MEATEADGIAVRAADQLSDRTAGQGRPCMKKAGFGIGSDFLIKMVVPAVCTEKTSFNR